MDKSNYKDTDLTRFMFNRRDVIKSEFESLYQQVSRNTRTHNGIVDSESLEKSESLLVANENFEIEISVRVGKRGG